MRQLTAKEKRRMTSALRYAATHHGPHGLCYGIEQYYRRLRDNHRIGDPDLTSEAYYLYDWISGMLGNHAYLEGWLTKRGLIKSNRFKEWSQEDLDTALNCRKAWAAWMIEELKK